MEHKKTASKAKSTAKADHIGQKTASGHAKSSTHKAKTASAPDHNYTVISNEPEDMAVLSETQRAEVFDMSLSEDPIGDRLAAQDARVQAALEPVGTNAAIQPVVTEDGVITPNAG